MRKPRTFTRVSARPRKSSTPSRASARDRRCGTSGRPPGRTDGEPLRRQPRASEIAARQRRTRDVELARDAGRHRLQACVKHIHLRVPDRTADRNARIVHVRVTRRPRGDLDGRLGRPVKIDQRHLPGRDHVARQARSKRLSAREDAFEPALRIRRSDRRRGGEQRRNELGDRNALLLEEIAEAAWIVSQVGRRDTYGGAGQQRQPDLPARGIKADGRPTEDDIVLVDGIVSHHPRPVIGEAAVRHHDAVWRS